LPSGWKTRLRNRLHKMSEDGLVWEDDHHTRFALVKGALTKTAPSKPTKTRQKAIQGPSVDKLKNQLKTLKQKYADLETRYHDLEEDYSRLETSSPAVADKENPFLDQSMFSDGEALVAQEQQPSAEEEEDQVGETPQQEQDRTFPEPMEVSSIDVNILPELEQPTSPTDREEQANLRAKFDQAMDEGKRALTEKEARIHELEQANQNLESELSTLRNKMEELKELHSGIIERLQSEWTKGTVETTALHDQLAREKDQLESRIHELEESCSHSRRELDSAQSELASVQGQVEAFRQQMESLNQEKTGLEARLERDKEALASDKQKTQEQLNEVSQTLGQLKKDYDQLVSEKHEMQQMMNREKDVYKAQLDRSVESIADFCRSFRDGNG
jgi:chromosome segregation ATPase